MDLLMSRLRSRFLSRGRENVRITSSMVGVMDLLG